MDAIDELARLFADVKRRDSRCRVFGADAHRYRLERARPSELLELETLLGVELPADYRTLLEHVGYGAGPYYGLYGPSAARAELDGLQPIPGDALPRAHASRPFPVLEPAPRTGLSAAAPFPPDGALLIGEQGSGTQWSVLALVGPHRGTVWDAGHFEGDVGEFFAARRPPGLLSAQEPGPLPALASPPRLLDWYRSWLERCLADLTH